MKVISYRSVPKPVPPDADVENLKNVVLPAWLLGGGIVVSIAAALFDRHRLTEALRLVALRLGFGTALMLAGMYFATLVRGIKLGPFWTALFKLCAITVAPGAVVALLYPLVAFIPFFGPLIACAVDFVLYFALLGVLFDLDEADTWYCVWIMFLLNLGVYFLLRL